MFVEIQEIPRHPHPLDKTHRSAESMLCCYQKVSTVFLCEERLPNSIPPAPPSFPASMREEEAVGTVRKLVMPKESSSSAGTFKYPPFMQLFKPTNQKREFKFRPIRTLLSVVVFGACI